MVVGGWNHTHYKGSITIQMSITLVHLYYPIGIISTHGLKIILLGFVYT